MTIKVHVHPEARFVFRARVERVIDGDTIDVTIDQGFHSYRVERLRLLLVNTPERKTTTLVAGNAAKDFTMKWLGYLVGTVWGLPVKIVDDSYWPLTIQTEKSDAFGRYLAMVWRDDGACLNDDLLSSGNAVPYE